MIHGIKQRKLGMYSSYRMSVLRNLTTSLILNGKIETTEAKAKEARKMVEKIITVAKNDNLTSRRKAYSLLFKKEAVSKLFELAKNDFAERNGGYTRILKLGLRRGDNAQLVLLELVK
ncbi:MAG: 50S ribosomal protein L17 [Caldiserica bacterium CG02_land_8_20_14_3_00_36_38]|jgi:large subunit ribosomal protein L17|nr:50S ribosomal protein L17 [Caldisericota bacterium]OIP13093.1 MAG: 50S ribosomal protein L17 [Caldisericum sp. CG2_30_36_11]PIP49355.1 MAG: 50S ribosomal protein L17 [Caldiserica bacterium CG23_combo_of_CG06-09_8_20_14_all_35_60]PIV54854.1 MAG: 50S ribosomal protein L17 [Caldiserica bacterium CG02_land_8_20_14_3_00_36_38]PIW10906.1 MAG: 50S ribosomal protein L17 [Caldiserica bacterium CG17_big_fil_post_rev_8_21_14_2_50_35_7]PIX29146.1 MAG: 50S ribosomal protein L17 [Caldiserica bacterium CG